MKEQSKLILLGLVALIVVAFVFNQGPKPTGTGTMGTMSVDDSPMIGVQYIADACIVQVITYDGKTNTGLGGVAVTIGLRTFTTGATYTANFGAFAFGSYSVKATKTGYNTFTSTVSLIGLFKTVSIYLTPTTTAPPVTSPPSPTLVQITIKTIPSSGYATINGDKRPTGTNGAIFTLTNGQTYTVTLSKEHYLTQTQTFTVSGVATKTYTLYEDSSNPLPPPPPATYTLTVTTTPADCTVTMAGQGTKQSPAAFPGLLAGTYYVSITKTGWTSILNEPVVVDMTKSVPFVLNQNNYTLIVKTTPSDATVTVNGAAKPSGTLGAPFSLTPGIYQVQVVKQGYTTKIENVNVDATKEVTIPLSVVPITITIFTQPTEATVSIPGQTPQNSGTTGALFTNLNPGQYAVTVSKQGYVTTTEQVVANADTQRTITLYVTQAPTPGGNETPAPSTPTTRTLTIVTSPTGAFVQVNNVGNMYSNVNDGKAIFYGVSPGTYTVTVNLSGYDDLISPATVTASADAQYTFSLSKGTVTETKKTPGFEMIVLIAALGIAMILIKKGRKK